MRAFLGTLQTNILSLERSLENLSPEESWHRHITTACIILGIFVIGALIWSCSPETERESGSKDSIRTPKTARTNHGLLEKNFNSESIDVGASHMFAYSNRDISGRPHKKMIHYDIDRTTGWSALVNLSGTCLKERHVWTTCSIYWLITMFVAVLVARVPGVTSYQTMRAPLSNLSAYFSALLAFMLGLFVSVIIQRWWECRLQCVGPIWESLCDIQLFLSTRCDESDLWAREQILRLSLLTHRLIYHEACGDNKGEEHLDHLMKVGLLMPEEREMLVGKSAQSQIPLVWIGQIMVKLGDKKGWVSNELQSLDDRIRTCRNAIGKIYAYCHTQLPFQYVHLMTFCILLCNMVVAIKCGLLAGEAMDPFDLPNIFLQAFQVIVEPWVYHSFMHLCSELANPFGRDFNDFPAFSFHCHMRAEGFEISKARTPLDLNKV